MNTEKTAVPCALRADVNTPWKVALPAPDHEVELGVANRARVTADDFAAVLTPLPEQLPDGGLIGPLYVYEKLKCTTRLCVADTPNEPRVTVKLPAAPEPPPLTTFTFHVPAFGTTVLDEAGERAPDSPITAATSAETTATPGLPTPFLFIASRSTTRAPAAHRGFLALALCEHHAMAAPGYRFVDTWVVPAPIERVYDAIGDVLAYERWWTDFVVRATGDEPPPEPGKSNELLVKAYLPYTVNFVLTVVEAERPRRILSSLSKDFDGSGEWTLEEEDGVTTATLDWRPTVNHPLIRRLSPVLRPLFRSNHNWAMRHGERQIREYLAHA